MGVRYEKMQLSMKYINSLKSAAGEVREWHMVKDKLCFGFYNEEEWKIFKEDIRNNGIMEPLMIWVEEDGSTLLAEGNHRRAAINQINEECNVKIEKISCDIRYFNGSEKNFLIKE